MIVLDVAQPVASVAYTLFGSCIAAGLLCGAVVAIVNSWRA